MRRVLTIILLAVAVPCSSAEAHYPTCSELTLVLVAADYPISGTPFLCQRILGTVGGTQVYRIFGPIYGPSYKAVIRIYHYRCSGKKKICDRGRVTFFRHIR